MDSPFTDYLLSFPWSPFFTILSFVWGACIGSFLNVCVYRIPNELSTVTPRSFCPGCKKPIPWYYNIPLLSWLMLGGKCKYCKCKISFRYFLIELLTAILFLLIWLKFSFSDGPRPLALVLMTDWKLVPIYWLVVSGLILGTFIDFEHLIIPDRVTIGGMIAGLIFSAIAPSLHNESTILRSMIWSGIGIISGGGSLWLMGVIGKMIFKKDAMGFGDVKLLAAIGAFMGSASVCFTILISSFAGSIAGITFVLAGCKKMQSRIPYGPYIALAAIIWILWGESMWQAYINLFLQEPSIP